MVTGVEKPYVLGMDIGGTNSVFGVVDQRGNVLVSDSVKTQEYTEVLEYVAAVTSKIKPMVSQFGGIEKFKGFGIGAPNGNFYSGTIEFAPNLPWKGVIRLKKNKSYDIRIITNRCNEHHSCYIITI